ncbi:hypothetical protein GWK47_046810 [Chionoecetes opilio]|uniref:Uncharacterized protein n=1 Tax=Chionoecetes opilio TaxID=41210 RepID=A0A8J5CUQ3_CHIOP|nr:hypothetical protein GWK47_046810 [Chionoecetes opilio]
MKNFFSVSRYLFLLVKVHPTIPPSLELIASSPAVDGQGLYCQASEAKSQASLTGSREGRVERWPSSLLWCTASNGMSTDLCESSVERRALLEISRHTLTKPLPRQQNNALRIRHLRYVSEEIRGIGLLRLKD